MIPSTVCCPYCRDPLVAGEAWVTCSRCYTAYHFNCWGENSECAVFGCGGTPKTTLRLWPRYIPPIVLGAAAIHPAIASLFSGVLFLAYVLSFVLTAGFASSATNAAIHHNREYQYGPVLLYISANMVSMLMFTLRWIHS